MPKEQITQKTIDYLNSVMDKKGCTNWTVDENDNRYILYTCHCGNSGRHNKQGIQRPQWNGCSLCSKKKTSSQTREAVINKLKCSGYELISINEGRAIEYKCCHNSFKTSTSNILKEGDFGGGCNICKYTDVVKTIEDEIFESKIEELGEGDKEEIVLERGPLYGGMHKGGITETDTHFKVSFTSNQGGNTTSYSKEIYGIEKAKELANNYKERQSIRNNLSTNRIRDVVVISHPKLPSLYVFKELMLSENKTTFIESEHAYRLHNVALRLVKDKGKKTHYVETGTRNDKQRLHTILYPEFSEVDHIDRNGLNNLRYNVREGGGRVNATNKSMLSNNTSGFKGVIYEGGTKPRWKAQWVDLETGSRKSKSFAVSKYGAEKSKMFAIAHRNNNAPTAEQVSK